MIVNRCIIGHKRGFSFPFYGGVVDEWAWRSLKGEVMSVSERIRVAVAAAITSGQTRYAIAKGAGIGYGVLARWLDEGRDIRASTIDKLAEHLGLELVPKASPAALRSEQPAVKKVRKANRL